MLFSTDQIRKYIKDKLQDLQHFSNKKKLQLLEYTLPFNKCFSIKGVQGIAGILQFNPNKPSLSKDELNKKKKKNHYNSYPSNEDSIPIVFKVSNKIDSSIEHEKDVLISLDEIKDWCPHFVSYLGYINVPISSNFIEVEKQEISDDEDSSNIENRSYFGNLSIEEEENKIQPGILSIWNYDEDSSPANMLLLNYIGEHSIHHMCRYGSMQQCLAQMVMTLAGLETAQQSIEFVHYDMHLDNILLKKCDEDLVFVYLYPDEKDNVIIPTLGHYPVIIDMGNSYCKNLIGSSVKTSISFYKSGLQPTVYDKLNDVHHFLLRCIDRLERFNPKWRDIGTKLMHHFRHLPIWRYKGWKKLPCDLVKNIIKLIYKVSPEMIDHEFWNEYTHEIMDILVMATSIHWKQDPNLLNPEILNKELAKNMQIFGYQLHLLDIHEDFNSDDNILFIIKELTNLSRITNTRITKKEEIAFKNYITPIVGKLPSQFNIIDFTYSIHCLGKIFSHLLAYYLTDNLEVIENAYKSIKMKRPYDAILFLQKMVPCRYRVNDSTVFRVFDHVNKKTIDIPATELLDSTSIHQELTTKYKSLLIDKIRNVIEFKE